jgi:hypothetical protein
MALGSTQPLTEMSNRNLPGGKGRPAREADSLTAMCEPIVKIKCDSLDVSETYELPGSITGITSSFFYRNREVSYLGVPFDTCSARA